MNTCKEKLKGSTFPRDHLFQFFWFTFGETEAQREKQPCSRAQGTLLPEPWSVSFHATRTSKHHGPLRCDSTLSCSPAPLQVQAEQRSIYGTRSQLCFFEVLKLPTLASVSSPA